MIYLLSKFCVEPININHIVDLILEYKKRLFDD